MPWAVADSGGGCKTCWVAFTGGREWPLTSGKPHMRIELALSSLMLVACMPPVALDADGGMTPGTSADASFFPSEASTLRISQRGAGELTVNGAAMRAPVNVTLDAGTQVTVVASPGIDQVVGSFVGLPCEPSRYVNECTFVMTGQIDGGVVFSDFFRAAFGAGGANITDLVVRDSVLALATIEGNGFGLPTQPTTQAAVAKLEPDAGFTQTSVSTAGFDSSNFLVLPDGGLWLAGVVRFHRAPINGRVVIWGGVDAGASGVVSQRADLALIHFDETSFKPTAATVIDQPDTVTGVSAIGPGPVIATNEGLVTSYSIDGDSTSVATLSITMQLQTAVQVASVTPFDIARIGAGVVGLALNDPLATGRCSPAGRDVVPTLSQYLSASQCGGLGAAPSLDAGVYVSVSVLDRTAVTPRFASISQRDLPLAGPSSRIATNFAHVHAHDELLAPRWMDTLAPIVIGHGPSGLVPYTVLDWEGQVLSVFFGSAPEGGVAGYRADNGLAVRCDPLSTNWVLMTLHDDVSGQMTWAHCFLGGPTAEGVLPVRASTRQSPVLGFNQQPPVIGAFGGVLLTSWAEVPLSRLPATLSFGSHVLQLDQSSSYVGLVTPP